MANDATGLVSPSGSSLPRLGCGFDFVLFLLSDPHDFSG